MTENIFNCYLEVKLYNKSYHVSL